MDQTPATHLQPEPAPAAPALPPKRRRRPRVLWSDAVFGEDPAWVELLDQLEAAGREDEAEEHYQPRRLRLLDGKNGACLDELQIPAEGLDEDVLTELLEAAGWPARTVHAKISRRGEPHIASRIYSRSSSFEDDDEAGGASSPPPEDIPAGPVDRVVKLVCSPDGPAWVQQMAAVAGPAIVELVGQGYERILQARARVEAQTRRVVREPLHATQGEQRAQLPAPDFQMLDM